MSMLWSGHINRGDKLDEYPFVPQREDRDHAEEQDKEERRQLAEQRKLSRSESRARLYWERRGGFDEW